MQGQLLPEDIYFLGKCDSKGGTLAGHGEITIKYQSEDLPQRAGDLWLSKGGRINRPAEGIFDLLILTLVEPQEGEPWPRWEEILEPFCSPHVAIEEVGRVELIREGSYCNVGENKVTRNYTFTVQAVVAPKDPDDFDALMQDYGDEKAVRSRRLLALGLAGQYHAMIGLRSIQGALDLEDDAAAETQTEGAQGNLGV